MNLSHFASRPALAGSYDILFVEAEGHSDMQTVDLFILRCRIAINC